MMVAARNIHIAQFVSRPLPHIVLRIDINLGVLEEGKQDGHVTVDGRQVERGQANLYKKERYKCTDL